MQSFRRISLALLAVIAIAGPGTTSNASAERADAPDTDQSAPSIELVDVFTATGQALVYDQIEAEYVLLRAGSRLRDFNVGTIKPSRIEVYRSSNAQLRFVITKNKTRRDTTSPATTAPATPPADNSLLDPYADTSSNTPSPPAPDKIKRVRAPAASRPAHKPGRAIISRKELNSSLDNLDRLSREVELELVKQGTRVSSIGEGTLPYRIGLRRGDVIVSVAGIRTTRLEDGADVFVKVSSAKKFSIQLLRDKEPMTISVAVQATR